jgi:hypothetical protein
MRIIKTLAILSLASVLTACVSPQKNYRPVPVNISEPAIGIVHTARVGEDMVRQGKYIEQDAIRLNEEVKFGVFSLYKLNPGYYLKEGENKKGEFYQPEPGPQGGSYEKAALADAYQAIYVEKKKSSICIVTVFNAKGCENNIDMTRTKRPAITTDGFQQTLIYSGRVGQKVRFGYREFSNNAARPAFNNDVEYDLDESKVFGYKGAEIQVIEATNREIRYVVVRNFNDAVR